MRRILAFILLTLTNPAVANTRISMCDTKHAEFVEALTQQATQAVESGKVPAPPDWLKPPHGCNDGIVYDMNDFYARLEFKVMKARLFRAFSGYPQALLDHQ